MRRDKRQTIAAIQLLRSEGKTLRDIAGVLGISKSSAQRFATLAPPEPLQLCPTCPIRCLARKG